jgi:SAM-dependent methyltransferase
MYGRDVAHVHDTGYGDFARDAAPGLLALLRAAGVRDGLVVDLGCGSGIWAAALLEAGYDVLGIDQSAELLEAGYDVLGIDQSAALLQIARRRAPAATFVQGSLFEAALPRCAAVTSISECVTYGPDPRAGRAAFVALLARVRAALVPGGVLVFDVVTPERPARRSWNEGEDWVICVDGRPDRDAGTYTRAMTVFRRGASSEVDRDAGAGASGDTWHRSDEVHDVWMYDPADVLADLRDAGFADARELDGYGERVRFAAGQAGFAAIRGGAG